jgi:hypothetical protein
MMSDPSDYNVCDEHETAYLKGGYCLECRIAKLEAHIQRIKNLPLTAIKKTALNDITECKLADYKEADWVFVVKESLLIEAHEQKP